MAVGHGATGKFTKKKYQSAPKISHLYSSTAVLVCFYFEVGGKFLSVIPGAPRVGLQSTTVHPASSFFNVPLPSCQTIRELTYQRYKLAMRSESLGSPSGAGKDEFLSNTLPASSQ